MKIFNSINNNISSNRGVTLTALAYLWSLIQLSIVYKVLTSVYSAISAQLRNSRIAMVIRAEDTGEITRNSLWYRLTSKIFSFSKSKRFGEATERFIQESIFIKSASYLLHNLLALNLKFIGNFVGISTLTYIAAVATTGTIPSIATGVIAIVSFIFMRIDINLTPIFANSALVKFVENVLDVKFSFDFFYKTRTKGESRVVFAVIFGLIAGLIAAFVSPFMAAAFVLGLTFVFLVLFKPMAGVFFTVFLAPIVPTMAMGALCLLTLVSFVIKAITTRNFEWKFDVTGFLIINLTAIFIISAMTSFSPGSIQVVLPRYLAFISFYFILTNMIKSRAQLHSLLVVFVISGALVSLYGILQFYFGVGITQAWVDEEMFATIGTRVFSTLENPNVLGIYLLLVIPVAIALMWSAKKWLTKTLFAGIAGIMFVTLLLTYSRGCWIAIFVAAALYVTFVKGKLWGLALLAIPFIPFILSLLPANIVERVTSIGNLEDTSSHYRLNIWLGSLNMLRDWWVSGIGLGTDAFMQVYPFYAFSAAFASHSHNLYMQIMIENGIVGFLVFMLVLVFAIKSLAFAWHVSPANPRFGNKGARSDKLSVMPVAIAVAIIGFLVQGIFDHALYNYRVFLMFWIVIGFASLSKFVADVGTTAPGRPPSKGDVASD